MNFVAELSRRNVFKVGIAYALTGWVLLQAGDFAFDLIGAPNWVIQSLTVIVLLGLPIALVFAWAFELTPEGIKREAEVDRSQSVSSQTGKKLNTAIVVLMALAIAWLLYDKFEGSGYLGSESNLQDDLASQEVTAGDLTLTPNISAPESDHTSIAVLPFVNMSGDAENEYFSDGISEELLNVLVRVSALEVASRTSSFAFKGRNVAVATIAKELGVNHVLEGSVRKAGNRVRITAQLIDADTDRHLWSDTYERELDDIFAIQEEISNAIVSSLRLTLDVDEAAAMERLQRPTANPEAYEAYLQGRFQWRQRGEANLKRAVESFQRAIALDPEFARAHEALASTWVVMPAWFNFDLGESKRLSLASANAALALDPNLGEAHSILAHVLQLDLDWLGAYREYARARDLEPRSAFVAQWFAEFLSDAGYNQRAMAMARNAYALDPAAPTINMVMATAASVMGDDDLAIQQMNQAVSQGIQPSRAVYGVMASLRRRNDIDTIRSAVMDQQPPQLLRDCTLAFLQPGEGTDLRTLLAKHPDSRPQVTSWCATQLDGDPEVAVSVLSDVAMAYSQQLRAAWVSTPMARRVRQTPGFAQLIESLNLLPLYEAEGWPELCHGLDDGGFACE